MAGLSNTLEKQILDFVFGRAATFNKPAFVAAALFTTAPTDAGGGVEVTAPSYDRVELDFAAATGNSPSIVQPLNDAIWPVAAEAWGRIVAVGIMDTDVKATGSVLAWALLTTPGDPGTPLPKDIGPNDQFQFPKEDLQINLD
jgi:hypothetical protein